MISIRKRKMKKRECHIGPLVRYSQVTLKEGKNNVDIPIGNTSTWYQISW